MPDVVYAPHEAIRELSDEQRWTRHGEPSAPVFVVEVDTLEGPNSQLDALDHKMRQEYFTHGVQLGWLIDPQNKIMVEYKRYPTDAPYRVGRTDWCDLDGGKCLARIHA